MPKPTARVLALLEVLQAGGTRTVAELAERLGVDERTVRRYVQHLVDLDVPVRSIRGRHGGYRIAAGFRLPPLMFTDGEAVAVMLSLVAARRLAPAVLPAEATASAADKIRRVLPEALGQRITTLLRSARFSAADDDLLGAPVGSLLLFAEAAAARCPVAVDYTDRHGRCTERVVHPYGLVVHSGRWYLVAAQPDDPRVRSFRLERIADPARRAGTFEVPEGFDAVEHVVSGLARAPWRHAVSVLVQGSTTAVIGRLPVGLAVVEDSGRPGWVRVQLRAEELDWVPALLVGLRSRFVVERPDALRDAVRLLGQQLVASAVPPSSALPTSPSRSNGRAG